MRVTKELLNAFQHAEVLTDEEVKALLAYYNAVRASLMPCPDEYKLVLSDVRAKADRLQEMVDARKESRARGANWARGYSQSQKVGSNICCSV